MKLKSRLIGIAVVGLLAALASADAFAQQADVPGAMNLAPPTQGVQPPRHWTAYEVTAERPFGDIDVAPAGSSVESVRLWSLGRSVLERYEINGRCAVITNPPNAARYGESDQQFCRNYKLAGFARPVSPRS
jgi:hypothetical protein